MNTLYHYKENLTLLAVYMISFYGQKLSCSFTPMRKAWCVN